MSRIDRSQFQQALRNGVNLNDAATVAKLTRAGVNVAELKAKADVNGDGWIRGGPELDKLFKHVDDFDRNGSSASFTNAGRAGQAFQALVSAAGGVAPTSGPREPRFAQQILAAASDRVAKEGPRYAFSEAPTSPLTTLSGNRRPGETRPSWLKNNNKCNQFVGDALTQAGVKAPTWAMRDGTLHYASAEKWPTFTNLFDRITDPSQIRPGDVIVRDYPGSGESTAHVEIITGTSPFSSVGAHRDGAYEQNTSDWLAGGRYDARKRAFEVNGNDVYVLRPKVAL
ncbi:MAG: hypothetical protein INH41_17705 [Myxococcaceae bacterium]|jgi:hypothetical protein|nr:hypothetical protein [Myxococcaceae bacterium]MCA3014221.1 hypothetical protein [Myxococcaceae bacterium]